MFKILIERNAEKELNNISSPIFDKLVLQINDLKTNPNPDGSRKLKGFDNKFRIRAGNYRILYEVDSVNKLIKILRVRHRREVNRNM